MTRNHPEAGSNGWIYDCQLVRYLRWRWSGVELIDRLIQSLRYMKLSISRLLWLSLALSLVTTILLPERSLAIEKSSKLKSRAGGTYLRLTYKHKGRTNQLGNPVYTLEAFVNGRKYRSFKAVSGTSTTQQRNRNVPNTHAPLPDGLYKVSPVITRGTIPEVGRTFVPIYPLFPTGRSDIGIHLDPSYNKSNGSDGTSGCVGLTASADRDAFNSYVAKYHPGKLIVRITS